MNQIIETLLTTKTMQVLDPDIANKLGAVAAYGSHRKLQDDAERLENNKRADAQVRALERIANALDRISGHLENRE